MPCVTGSDSTSQTAGLEREFAELGCTASRLDRSNPTPRCRRALIAAIPMNSKPASMPSMRAPITSICPAAATSAFSCMRRSRSSISNPLAMRRICESWMARDDVRELFASAMRRHGVNDPRWLARGREIVFNALTSRVALGETVLEGGLYRLPERPRNGIRVSDSRETSLVARRRPGRRVDRRTGLHKGFYRLGIPSATS